MPRWATLVPLCTVSIAVLTASHHVDAATYREDFDDAHLPDVWTVETEGGAFQEVDDGLMTQVSESVADGVNLVCTVPLEGDVAVEVKIDATGIPAGSYGHFGFFDDMLAPMVNTQMHPHWVDVLFFRAGAGEVVLNDGQPAAGWNRSGLRQAVSAGWHVWRIEVEDEHALFLMDDEITGEGDTIDTERYFILSVDPYTTHYLGTWVVDYVELTSDSMAGLAVDPHGSLATSWGAVKASAATASGGTD